MARVGSIAEPPEIESPQLEPETQSPEPSAPGAPEKIGFFQQLSDYTPTQWERLMIYVYRLAPITDRLATGNKAVYARKYAGPVDEDQLKHDLGSGTYRLQLNQQGAKGNSKPIRQHVIEIEDTKFPPQVPEGEWVDDPRNKRWAWCRKKATDNPDSATAGASQWTPDSVMRFVKELRPEAPKEDHISITKAVLDAVRETRTSMSELSDPMKLIGMITQIVNMSRPATPAQDNGVVTILTQMLQAAEKRAEAAEKIAAEERKEAAAERQRQHELQLKAMEQKSSGNDMLEVVDKVLGIKERLTEDSGPRANRKWPEMLIEDYGEKLLDVAGRFVTGYRAQPQPQPRPQPARQPQPQQPQPQPATTVQNQPAEQQAPAGDPMPQVQLDPEVLFIAQLFEARGGDFVGAFSSDPNGGALLAETMIRYANPIYERVARAGKAKILEAIACFPQMQADLAKIGSAEMLSDFIDDFVAGPEDDEEDDDEHDEFPEAKAPVAVPSSKKKKATA